MYRILVVSPEIETLEAIKQFLSREGYQVATAHSVVDALGMVARSVPEMLIIDVNAPSMDGVALCRRLRTSPRTSNSPIILVGPNSRQSVTEALECGGDDYLAKPFAVRELGARVRAHLRRTSGLMGEVVPLLKLVPDTQIVYLNDREIALTGVEFELLTYLCRRPNQLHSTQDLLTNVWRYPQGAGDAALVRNHIRNLRRKIEDDPERPSIIQSRHGRGYTIRASVQIEPGMVYQAR
jgi:DNA-binding response OmpR family regulator